MDREERRDEFLRLMYGEMWNNINRHLTVTWQAVGVVAAGFAVFLGIADKNPSMIDAAAGLMIIVSGWLLSHIYDANTWFNRNLGIIANIERQFLAKNDAAEIQFYFTEPHRRRLLSHLRVQRDFGLAAAVLVLVTHFLVRVLPGIHEPWDHFDPIRTLPYLAVLGCIWWVGYSRREQRESVDEFVIKSPGRTVKEE